MCSTKANNTFLDTLAQLSTNGHNQLSQKQLQEKLTLQKRAKAKAFTNSFLFDLIDLNSPLKKSYWSTYHCASTILQQDTTIKAKYCNQRWCLTCNRIRTAKMINGYKEPIQALKDTHFVTLTIPNVKGRYLKASIEQMNKYIADIRNNLKKTYGITLKGLRKYECTYNKATNEYHPHFHLIVESIEASQKLVDLWLKKYPKASRKAQDIRPTQENSLVELCKYFTKVITKDNDYNPKAIDIMCRAVKGKRTFQSMGIKKQVSEDIEEIQSQQITFKEPKIEIWGWEKEVYDWVSADGELLSEYEPTQHDLSIINQEYKTTKDVQTIRPIIKEVKKSAIEMHRIGIQSNERICKE